MLNSTIKYDNEQAVPLYIQLYEHIKKEITEGFIQPETKLPSIRQLAARLHLSKTTVEAAYQQLKAEGYIASSPKSGYYVNKLEYSHSIKPKVQAAYLEGANVMAEDDDSFKTWLYDFGSDSLDAESFDFKLWHKYVNKVFRKEKRLLTYGSSQGEPELRREIARYLHGSRGVICGPQQVVIGAGIQSLLHLVAGLLTPAYGPIGFEEPGFRKGRYVFRDHGFEIIPIPIDEQGIRVDLLNQSRARLVYVSPSHQFPMGAAIPVNRRMQLLKWAQSQGRLIIEDDYDGELRYLGRPLPSLQGLNQGRNVIYLGTFSKTMLPSLRISYMVLPPELLQLYQQYGGRYNQTSSKIEQLALAAYMRDGCLEKQVRRLRKIYARKNQILIEALTRIMRDKVRIIGQESGLHIVLEVQTTADPEELAGLAAEAGVRIQPVTYYFMEEKTNKPPLVLLAYGGISTDLIEPAVKVLREAWGYLIWQ